MRLRTSRHGSNRGAHSALQPLARSRAVVGGRLCGRGSLSGSGSRPFHRQNPQQDHEISLRFEKLRCDPFLASRSNRPSPRSAWDRPPRPGFRCKRDVAADDWRRESATGFRQSFDRFAHLPEIFRLVGIAEVEVIGDGKIAPEQVRLRAASATAIRPPSCGSSRQ